MSAEQGASVDVLRVPFTAGPPGRIDENGYILVRQPLSERSFMRTLARACKGELTETNIHVYVKLMASTGLMVRGWVKYCRTYHAEAVAAAEGRQKG